jgi:hypothetical protein
MRTFTARLALAASAAGAAAIVCLTSVAPAHADQHGYDAVVCHTDTAYIYQYEDTGSTRRDALPRGAHFQVYHEDGGWDFGVRNYNSISGYVLASQLCRADGSALAPAATPAAAKPAVSPAVSGDRRCVDWSVLLVRNYPAGQAWTQLYQAQSFSVYEYRDSGWARGYAWGHVDTDQSPYAPPYNDVWVETAGLGKHINDGSSC